MTETTDISNQTVLRIPMLLISFWYLLIHWLFQVHTSLYPYSSLTYKAFAVISQQGIHQAQLSLWSAWLRRHQDMSLTDEANCRSMIWHDTRICSHQALNLKHGIGSWTTIQIMKQWPKTRIIFQNSESSSSCRVRLRSFRSDTCRQKLVPFANEM